jgi:hypothetical protein
MIKKFKVWFRLKKLIKLTRASVSRLVSADEHKESAKSNCPTRPRLTE